MVEPAGPRLEPRRYGRPRRLAFRLVERASVLLGGRAHYRRRHLAPGRLVLREERVAVDGLPEGLEGFAIAHLSDLHAGPFLREGDLAPVVDLVNARRPDLVALTGDLVTRSADEAFLVLDDLARLDARYGTLGVFGNHDYRGRREGEIASAYARRGIRFLRNECARVDTGEGVLAVVGVEDLEEGKVVDVGAARSGVARGDVELVLCHNPGGAAALSREGCAAVLSGHTHGSQIAVPLVRRLGPRHPGGRVRHGTTVAITSRGLGVVGVPLRVRAPAEVVWVVLERGAGRAG